MQNNMHMLMDGVQYLIQMKIKSVTVPDQRMEPVPIFQFFGKVPVPVHRTGNCHRPISDWSISSYFFKCSIDTDFSVVYLVH